MQFNHRVARKVFYKSKAILLSVAVSFIGCLDLFDIIDLKALVRMLGVPEGKVAGTIALLTIVFGILRKFSAASDIGLSDGVNVRSIDEAGSARVEDKD